jgi:hypothetical protein
MRGRPTKVVDEEKKPDPDARHSRNNTIALKTRKNKKRNTHTTWKVQELQAGINTSKT